MPANTATLNPHSLHPAETFFWKSAETNCFVITVAKRVIASAVIPLELLSRLFVNAVIVIYNFSLETPENSLDSHGYSKGGGFDEQVPEDPYPKPGTPLRTRGGSNDGNFRDKSTQSKISSHTVQLILNAKKDTPSKPFPKEVCVLKIRGTLYGQALGDALGMFTEFLPTAQAQQFNLQQIEFSDRAKFNTKGVNQKHVHRFPENGWTDDTDQMILVGCAEQESRLDPTVSKERRMAQQLMNWRNHGLNGFSSVQQHSFPSRQDSNSTDEYRKKIGCQGLGALTSQVLEHADFLNDPHAAALAVWKESNEAIQPRLAANGALMRTSILGVIHKDDLAQTVLETIRYAKVTHADPRCIASSVALTSATALLHAGAAPADAVKHAETIAVGVLWDEMDAVKEHLNDKEREEWREIAKRFEKELRDCMHASLTELDLGHGLIGYTFKALGAAFYAMREAIRLMGEEGASPETVFRKVVEEIIFQGGDADTNAAPAAALVGAYLGEEAIPASWRSGLHNQDKVVIEQQIAAIEKIKEVLPLTPEAQRDKIRGAAYGQAIGDGLGLFIEFMREEEAQRAKFSGLEFSDRAKFNDRHCVNKFPVDGWTDDTDQMLLISHAEWEYQKDPNTSKEVYLARQLDNWLKHGLNGYSSVPQNSFYSRQDPNSEDIHRKEIACEDVGVSTLSVINHPQFLQNPYIASLEVWKNSSAEVQRRNAANGALMRTSILGTIYRNNINLVVQETIRHAKVTHADPRAIASAVALTVAIARLLTGSKIEDALQEAEVTAVAVLYNQMELVKEHLIPKEVNNWKKIAQRFEKELRESMNPPSLRALKLGAGFIGYTFKCLGAAFYAARAAMRAMEENTSSPELIFRSLLEEIIFEGGDADTNAAAAGPLLGAYLGESAIPKSWKNALYPQDKIVLEEALMQAETIAQTVS